jgi:hypothetical protein
VDHRVATGSGDDPTELPRLRQFAAEQAALRRVATLVADGARPEVFTAVADELAGLVGAEAAFVSRTDPISGKRGEPDKFMTVVGTFGRLSDAMPVGFRFKLEPGMVSMAAFESGRPARIKGEQMLTGPFGRLVGDLRMRAAVATPIVVEGRQWGVFPVRSAALHHAVCAQRRDDRARVVGQHAGIPGRPAHRQLWSVEQGRDNQRRANRPDDLGDIVVLGEILTH